MDIFQHSQCLATSYLKIINYCRYALKVKLLLDIMTTDGMELGMADDIKLGCDDGMELGIADGRELGCAGL